MRIGLLETSYRRKSLDRELQRTASQLNGQIIDMGGENERRRGQFRPPQRANLQWTCVNVDATELPEVVADVEQMPFSGACASAVVCTELLEHVEQPEAVIHESYRLLRSGGLFICSMPFLYRVHADPFDYQRYTKTKLAKILAESGFEEAEIRPQGFYFAVMADMIRDGLNQIRLRSVRWPIAMAIWPLLKLLVYLDGRTWVRHSDRLSSYTTGYFITATKGVVATRTPG